MATRMWVSAFKVIAHKTFVNVISTSLADGFCRVYFPVVAAAAAAFCKSNHVLLCA